MVDVDLRTFRIPSLAPPGTAAYPSLRHREPIPGAGHDAHVLTSTPGATDTDRRRGANRLTEMKLRVPSEFRSERVRTGASALRVIRWHRGAAAAAAGSAAGSAEAAGGGARPLARLRKSLLLRLPLTSRPRGTITFPEVRFAPDDRRAELVGTLARFFSSDVGFELVKPVRIHAERELFLELDYEALKARADIPDLFAALELAPR